WRRSRAGRPRLDVRRSLRDLDRAAAPRRAVAPLSPLEMTHSAEAPASTSTATTTPSSSAVGPRPSVAASRRSICSRSSCSRRPVAADPTAVATRPPALVETRIRLCPARTGSDSPLPALPINFISTH
ncbi:hypothetical protein PENTCL1PPCAC_25267, partial [Pristionchus entomophagus]